MTHNYDVGYRKPPQRTRFKRGQSGNPNGRPKKSLNLTTALTAELSETITVRENGKTRRVSKQKALLKALMAKAMQGDVKAISAVLALNARLLDSAPGPDDDALTNDELLILRRFAPQAAEAAKKRGRTR